MQNQTKVCGYNIIIEHSIQFNIRHSLLTHHRTHLGLELFTLNFQAQYCGNTNRDLWIISYYYMGGRYTNSRHFQRYTILYYKYHGFFSRDILSAVQETLDPAANYSNDIIS